MQRLEADYLLPALLLLMAALAVAGTERRLAIVAGRTVFPLIQVIHLHTRTALFVFERLCVAIFAREHGSVKLMAECDGRHGL